MCKHTGGPFVFSCLPENKGNLIVGTVTNQLFLFIHWGQRFVFIPGWVSFVQPNLHQRNPVCCGLRPELVSLASSLNRIDNVTLRNPTSAHSSYQFWYELPVTEISPLPGENGEGGPEHSAEFDTTVVRGSNLKTRNLLRFKTAT